jgi:hypothetical protein
MILCHHAIISDIDSTNIKFYKYTEFQIIIYDGKRFIFRHRSIIEMIFFQIYNSALVFSPAKTIIRNMFSDQLTTWIKGLPMVELLNAFPSIDIPQPDRLIH